MSPLYLKKFIFIIWFTWQVILHAFYSNVFSLFNLYQRIVFFTQFVYGVDLYHWYYVAKYVIWSFLSIDTVFSMFQLSKEIFSFYFISSLSTSPINAIQLHSKCFDSETPICKLQELWGILYDRYDRGMIISVFLVKIFGCNSYLTKFETRHFYY